MKRIKILLATVVLLLPLFVVGQLKEKLPTPIPSSPNASALGKFGEIPVNLYTGLPTIAIPLFETQIQDFNFSSSLAYHASGVKIDEIAGSNGLGWALSIGGVISVSEKGGPDEAYGGYRWASEPSWKRVARFKDNSLTPQQRNQFLLEAANGFIDTEPDIYSFSFFGNNGKFLIDTNGKIKMIPYSDYKVERNGLNFIITDLNGNKFFFEDRETTTTVTTTTKDSEYAVTSDPRQYTSSWYLSKIILAKGAEINYSYITTTIEPTYEGSEAKYLLIPESQAFDNNGNSVFENYFTYKTISNTNIQQKKNSTITFPGGKIVFEYYSNPRTDLAGDFALSSLSLYRIESMDHLVSKFTFKYIYDNFNSRLYLDKIIKIDLSDPNNEKISWKMDYDNISSLPNIGSNSKDFWGYYNAKVNLNLIPTDLVGYPKNLNGAEREANPNVSRYGTLYKIQYPTKGYTLFEYENHDYGAEAMSGEFTDSLFINTPINHSVTLPSSGVEFTSQFTITFPQYVNISSTMQGWGNYIEIFNSESSPQSQFNYSHQGPGNQSIDNKSSEVYLYPGTYTIRGMNYESDWTCTMNVSFKNRVFNGYGFSKLAGGLRIKSIRNFDHTNTATGTKKFIYKNENNMDRSSGVLVSKFYNQYYRNLSRTFYLNNFFFTEKLGFYKVLMSYSSLASSLSQGSHISYREVHVIDSNNVNAGKTVFKYQNPLDISDLLFETFPFGLGKSNDWARGELKQKIDYEYVNGIYKKIRSLKNIYSIDGDALNGLPGMLVGFEKESNLYPSTNIYAYHQYLLNTLRFNLVESIDTSFHGNSFLINRKQFYHESPRHNFTTKEISNSSDGSSKGRISLYPKDFALGTSFIDAMVNQNLISKPIETVEFSIRDNQTYIMNGVIKEFDINGKGLLEKSYNLENEKGLDISNFKFSNSAQGLLPDYQNILSYAKDSYYRKKFDADYDEFANLVQIKSENGSPSSFLYSYNSMLPIAEIKNVSYGQITSLLGSSAIQLFSTQNPSDVQVNNFLAPLRSGALPDAYVNTYTYNLLVGMTSQTDPKGMTTYYEYDSFQRLKHIKDQNGNIVKSYCYNYAGQVSDCNVGGNTGSTANWVNTGMNSECETQPDPFFNNQPAVTGNMLIEQVDNNPNSPTYNTTRKITDPTAQPGSCPPSYYYTTETDPYLSSVTFNAKRSYDDGTTKTMRFRVRHDSIYYPWGITEEYVDIQISSSEGGTGYNFIMVNAASYLEVELMEVF